MMKFPSFDKLMLRLGYVSKAELEYWKQCADNDSSLVAELVSEMQNMREADDDTQADLDKLREAYHMAMDENTRLKGYLEELYRRLAEMRLGL